MSTEIVTRLKALKLHGMASNWPELVARCRHAALPEPDRIVAAPSLEAGGALEDERLAGPGPASRDFFAFDIEASGDALQEEVHLPLAAARFGMADVDPLRARSGVGPGCRRLAAWPRRYGIAFQRHELLALRRRLKGRRVGWAHACSKQSNYFWPARTGGSWWPAVRGLLHRRK